MERDPPSFHELEIFLAFAQHEHLGRAAESLDLSIPAVQRAVRSLEARLGVALIRRDGRRVRLLHAGRIMADQAAKILRSRGDAVDIVRLAAGREQLVLRVGYMYSLGLRVLPDLIADVLRHEPAMRIEFRNGGTDELVDRLLAGELDAVCVAPLPVQTDVAVVPIFSDPYVLCVNRDDPLASRSEIDLRQVRDRDFAALREGFGSRRFMLSACARAGFVPRIAFNVDDIFTVEGLVGAGLAVAVLPASLSDHIHPRVAHVPLHASIATTRTVGIAFLASQRRQRGLQLLVDAAHRYAARNDHGNFVSCNVAGDAPMLLTI